MIYRNVLIKLNQKITIDFLKKIVNKKKMLSHVWVLVFGVWGQSEMLHFYYEHCGMYLHSISGFISIYLLLFKKCAQCERRLYFVRALYIIIFLFVKCGSCCGSYQFRTKSFISLWLYSMCSVFQSIFFSSLFFILWPYLVAICLFCFAHAS